LANTNSAQAPRNQTGAAAARADSAQASSPRQEFEEASIRPCDPDNLPPTPPGARGGGANSFQMTPGRTHALCMTLATLIREAYGYAPADINPGGRGPRLGRLNTVYGLGVEDGRRVRGGPDWVRSERYTIDAVADGASDAATMSGPMLRDLFERRFKLKAHIETEQIPAFAIIVAPGGLKMKEGTCTPPDPSEAPLRSATELVRDNVQAARRGATTAGACGFYGTPNGPNMLFVGAGAGVSGLGGIVPGLGGIMGAPIINRTGIPLTATFNTVLEFAPDERTPGRGARLGTPVSAVGRGLESANEPAEVPRAPNIFTALEDQLGLKLEPAQAPREYIVIDQVERPSPN
jgi:uncharacterized protein (TIGR03435 family)